MAKGIVKEQQPGPVVSADQALTVAHADAQKAYQDLTNYRIRIALEEDGWHIDYDLKNPTWKGGGPHYVVDAASGVIRSKRYDQ